MGPAVMHWIADELARDGVVIPSSALSAAVSSARPSSHLQCLLRDKISLEAPRLRSAICHDSEARMYSAATLVARRLVLLSVLGVMAPALAAADAVRQAADGNALTLPKSAIVLTLTGLNFNLTNYMPNQFGGIFKRPTYVIRQVRYPASLASDSISKGVDALDKALRETSGDVIVLAHSQGAQVASHWIRRHLDDANGPASDRIVFILTGNPLRAEGGHIIGRREVGGTIGEPTPVSTRWRIIDVARRYDGWADWPANEANSQAVQNARAGMLLFHPRYDAIILEDPSHTVWTRGRTTFVLTHEELPLWRTGGHYPDHVRAAMQSHIESAYRRRGNGPSETTPSPEK